jgi:hypothetical protein
MEIDFYKIHAYGNDYLLVDCVFKNSLEPKDFPIVAKSMCRYSFSVTILGASESVLDSIRLCARAVTSSTPVLRTKKRSF